MSLTPELRAPGRRPATLVEVVLGAGHPERPALRGPEGPVSHAELGDRVRATAEEYAGARRLVLLAPGNDVDSVVEYLAALAAGQVVLLADERAIPGLVEGYDPDVVADPGTGRRTFRRSESVHDLHPDLALLLSTSGTTGSPKLVRLSHANLLANAEAIADTLGIRSDDVAATTLPLHYCYGLSVLHSHLVRGAAVSLTNDSVIDPAFWERARHDGVTTFPGVPHTFDLLASRGFRGSDLPTLRYLTQAGGRMDPQRVRALASQGAREGFELVVMYGQAEATARMAVLDAADVATAPEAIGRPLPGTSFDLAPVEGAGPGVGELVFHGANVMLGYATEPADLALGRTVEALHTGDLGRQRPDGRWEVVGRCRRIAKVFGLRVDLDRAERELARVGTVAVLADAGDRLVVGVCEAARPVDVDEVRARVADVTGLAPAGVTVVVRSELPRLPNGKVDYRTLATLGEDTCPAVTGALTADDVVAVYVRLLGRPDARPTDSFVGLGGDSLAYVEVSLQLERLLGHLPADWPTRPAAALADAPRRPPRRRRGRGAGRGRQVETNVVLRALAMVMIVGSHANLFVLAGGAHVLLAVVGFNLGRFQVAGLDRVTRVRSLVRATSRVVVPSVLVIGAAALASPDVGWRQVLLLTSFTEWAWSEPRWSWWFIEALVQALVVLTLLLAVPAVDRAVRRWPFGVPIALTLVVVPLRYDLLDIPGDHLHRLHGILWLVTLGWAASQARSTRQRWLVTVLAVAMTPGFFGLDLGRSLLLDLGIVLLVWVPHLRVPAPVARVVSPLAGASLWIYLLHWQVYPHLEDRWPLLATVLSLLVGVVAWRAWERGTALLRKGHSPGRSTPAS